MPDAGTPLDPFLRSGRAAAPRTLVDVLEATTAAHPEASALEDERGALSYRELSAQVAVAASALAAAGVGRGDRVGVRMPSGDRRLYVAILAVLTAGAAYVPVDADDPEERADLVFGEAQVAGVVGAGGVFRTAGQDETQGVPLFGARAPHASTADRRGPGAPARPPRPEPADDAWVIFTSGSTGTPKGVAASHRAAAAFADAEAELFLADDPLGPLGPGDRVLAGLSVAFDASCEEMWLAWRSGACLVPAPRSLVRTGADLGPWLVTHGITVVSTVPTLAALWPAEALESVRLLIFGGEAFPPELVDRVCGDGREVWNTYGPTESTVVATGALVVPGATVRIGLPLLGWDVAVVDPAGDPVAEGEVGELIIGGVGLARYLDPAKDAEKYAPHPQLGWSRAYRSGDLVVLDREGLVFRGRADDQVKVGGRRIELGEIESALQALPGVAGAAAAVRETSAGNRVIVGYLALHGGGAGAGPGAGTATAPAPTLDRAAALARLREALPAALVPLLTVVDGDLPTKTSGKIDRDALPWPLADQAPDDGPAGTGSGTGPGALGPDEAVLAADWQAVLGLPVGDASAEFFDLGGGSLAAAQLVARIRERDPEYTVADVYSHPRLGAMADDLAQRRAGVAGDPAGPSRTEHHRSLPVPARTQWVQTLLGLPLHLLAGLRWLTIALTASTVLRAAGGFDVLPRVDVWLLVVGIVVFVTPPGRMAISVAAARLLLSGVAAGDHPRGGGVHLRLWLAEQVQLQTAATGLAGAPWISYYARALGARIAPDVDLHTLPPVTGMLRVGRGASIEPEVDLSGWWVDGDVLRLGAVRIGAGSTVGMRSTLLPGTRIGKHATVAPGSAVFGRVPAGQAWSGSPAARVGKARTWWPAERPDRARPWLWAYGVSSLLISLLPVASLSAGGAVVAASVRGSATLGEAWWRAVAGAVPGTLLAGVVAALVVVGAVRLLALGVREGTWAVRSRVGWQIWSTERLLDLARTYLFPLYSSLATPVWLRLLGARVGRDVEASTVLLLPCMTTIRDGAFLADDTLVASYELGGGWLRVARAEIGRRAFLGNSGMAGPGHTVPKDGLVAVLSAAPRSSKAGSSWLGSPPVRLRRTVAVADESRTFRPPARLRAARVAWELSRVVPVVVTVLIGLGLVFGLWAVTSALGLLAASLLSAVLLLAAGAVAAAVSTAAKWLLIGRVRASEQPLWSSFVWRSETADVFVEMCAAPWFARAASGTPALVWWLRSLGARIGRGVWTESYWLPEADLVTLGDGSTVNRGCVVQTHLFHDRIMSMDSVTLRAGATLGPHGVVLPAAVLGEHATVGPASLVMRGEGVPAGSRWSGNPIGPWREVTFADYHAVTS
ncbi:non-ribosomal peptide synthetase-like protein [Frigoribacterium sp. PvP120]|uniref:Pls/PosA family non-ribosomal peptide synthetase n=1 Tax=unclassified Frigoribacterium TaxID=2627005 RepID=UPI001AE3A6AD|nr:Pls/PosA family non-ribosomal peptide synthetase [Frigoribacterium sp. PvP121]MBP1242319.1 non-ribosomal peptide synthetase-like protein [Frigoribacterium sp. PvP121]